MSATPPNSNQERGEEPAEQEVPIVRDRRRIDPDTGAVRDADIPGADAPAPGVTDPGVPAEPAGGAGDGAADEVTDLRQQLGERTQDLQRLQAEYLNYKRRVDRDRESVRELAVANALTELLPVLDDIGRAREHGEVEGGFKAVADSLEAALSKLGLERYGEVGDPFDPQVHEALMHAYSDEVTETSCTAILQPGYRMGERVLRPARVAVAEPTADLGAEPAAEPADQVEGEGTATDVPPSEQG